MSDQPLETPLRPSTNARTIPFAREERPVYAPEPAATVTPKASPAWMPYIIGAVIAGLVMVLFYQQSQIDRLTRDLGTVTDSVRSSDVRSRLDAGDAKLQELNTRLNYLDSKITAVDQKSQISLDKWKAQENRGNFFTDTVKRIGEALGIK